MVEVGFDKRIDSITQPSCEPSKREGLMKVCFNAVIGIATWDESRILTDSRRYS